MRLLSLIVFILRLAPDAAALDGNRDALSLWYRQPAGRWTEALPVGNGRLAAMVFGDLRRERIQLNEDTVWSGEKRDRSNPEAQFSSLGSEHLLMEPFWSQGPLDSEASLQVEVLDSETRASL